MKNHIETLAKANDRYSVLKSDNDFLRFLTELQFTFLGFNMPRTKEICSQINELSKNVQDDKKRVVFENFSTGILEFLNSQYSDAMFSLETAIFSSYEESPLVRGFLSNTIGLAYRNIGDHTQSLNHHTRSKNLLNDSSRFAAIQAINYYQIGEIHAEMKDFREARKFLNDSLRINITPEYDHLIKFRSNVGLADIEMKFSDYEKAKEYLNTSKPFHKDNPVHKSKYLNSLANLYYSEGLYEKSIEVELQSLELRKLSGMKDAACSSMICLGKNYIALSQIQNAKKYLNEALLISQELGVAKKELVIRELLCEIYKIKGDLKTAMKHLERHVELLKTISISQQLKTFQLKSKLLSEQKDSIEKSLNELASSHEYARKIQRAMLHPESEITKYLDESFIFFQPHGAVSGDFYWLGKQSGKTIIIAGDCTGHGVPAGMLTMKGHGLLSRIISDLGIIEPAEILKELHKKLKYDLDFEQSQIEDGMDVAVCVIDKKNETLEFAGARRPLIIIENGHAQKIKGTSKSIGGTFYDTDTDFVSNTVELNGNKDFYIFSDGFQDQFGGPNTKKYKTNRFVEFLKTIAFDSPMQQNQSLADELINWRTSKNGGITPQTDDILVIGFKA